LHQPGFIDAGDKPPGEKPAEIVMAAMADVPVLDQFCRHATNLYRLWMCHIVFQSARQNQTRLQPN
jgi:hypothetical protein